MNSGFDTDTHVPGKQMLSPAADVEHPTMDVAVAKSVTKREIPIKDRYFRIPKPSVESNLFMIKIERVV